MPRTGMLAGLRARLLLLVFLALLPALLYASYLVVEQRGLMRPALIGAGILGLVLLIVLTKAADLLILRPVHALVTTARRLAAGDLSARSGISNGDNEIHQLAKAFDDMAGTLQMRVIESQRAQNALAQSEARFRRLTESARDVIYRYRISPDRSFEYVSPAALQMIGYTSEELYDNPHIALVHADDLAVLNDMIEGRAPDTVELRWLHKLGAVVWTEQRYVVVYDNEGRRVALEGIARDITTRKQSEEELRLLQSVTLAINDAKDVEAALSVVLRSVCQATGWSIGQAWLPDADGAGLKCSPAWYGHAAGLESFRSACESSLVSLRSKEWIAEVVRERSPLWLRDVATAEANERTRRASAVGLRTAMAVPVVVGTELEAVLEFLGREPRAEDEHILRTVSSVAAQLGTVIRRKRSDERLSYLAQHDPITGLPNRALLADRLRQAMFQASRHNRLVAVAFIDIDRFKTINDSLGHDAGDQLLRAIGERLRGCVRNGDTVGRISGDEFALVLADMAHVDDAARLAHKILVHIRRPYVVAGQELYLGASLGVTLYPHDAEDVDALLRNAGVASYRAKEMGRNTYQFYAAEMTTHAQERLKLEAALRRALERDEFVLHYQPIVELEAGRVIGAEALLRWRHPERGMVPPMEFIPLAEETGLIVSIGEWVLRAACAQCVAWERAGLGKLRMAVNISPPQFQRSDLADTILQILRETRLPADRLELELTESLLMRHPETTIANMQRLSDMGVQLSIDDFGTGYSSLSYLKRFPIHRLKIDRSFVKGIPLDGDDAAIATAIIAMAHKLDLNVVAEGVETADQLTYLRNHECDVMQGYYFSPPLPNEEYIALLSKRPSLTFPSNGPH